MPRKFLAPNEKITNYSTWQLVKDVYKYIHPYRGNFFIGSFLRFIGDLVNLYPNYALASMVTLISTGAIVGHTNRLWIIVVLWFASAMTRTVTIYFGKKYIYNLANKIQIDVELQSISHIFKLDISWHENENSGNKIKRIQNASLGYKKLLNIWVNNLIEIVISFIGIIIIIYFINKLLALYIVIFLIVYFILVKILLKKSALASYNENVAGEDVSGLQFEAINNIRTIKIIPMVDTAVSRLKVFSDILYDKTKIRVFWVMNRSNGSALVALLFKAAMLIFVLNGVIHGHYEVGILVLFNGYFNRAWESVEELTGVSEDILVSRYSISRLNEIMNEPVRIDDEENKINFPTDWKIIELKNVSFAYEDNQVLKNISFNINRGEKVGIIGLSGAGKSTLYKLLLKEYENFEGEILIDGIRIQEISKVDYFKHVAVVLQETEVFNFSLRENIYLAKPGNSDKEKELQKALEIAHINEFLPKLPEGVDTSIGEKGVRLSGGEKQRLGIARAVFKQPQLLLLDEATSHLDLESEEKIQDSLHQFFRSVTAVVIAHRLTTIKEMDKILVIEDGQIIESGNFAELHGKQGRFYELWEKQRL